MKVLSLFDGIACGRVALERIGVKVDRYVAFEIEDSAIKIAKANYPDIEECGDVFKADYTQYRGFDLLIGGSPCFTKGHLVLTKDGYKPIEEIKVGDMVYTHNDRYKPVTAIGHKQSDDVYRISSQGTDDFEVTGNHPFYISQMKREWNNERRCSERHFSDPAWVEAKDLSKGDFMASPCIVTEENPLNLTEEDCWLLGRYLADGHIRNDKRKNRNNSYHYAVVYSIGSKKVDEFLNHVKSYHITHYPHSKSVERCLICSQKWVELILNLNLGRCCYEKQVPTVLLNLPKNLCVALAEGYMSGDGHKDRQWDAFHACTVSKKLAYSMALLIQKAYGVNCGVKKIASRGSKGIIEGREVNLNQQWGLHFNKVMKPQSVAHVDGTKVYTPFRGKVKIESATVYNISVADDESYICNNRVVHNCTNWSIAKAGHGRETTNSGVGWELFQQYMRALKESGVKYYLYENNASMSKEIRKAISDAFGHEPLEINSDLVSAQTRKRLYWTNIPEASVPKATGIKLSSIIESGFVDREKSLCVPRRYAGFQGSQSYLCRRYFGKSMGQAVFEATGNATTRQAKFTAFKDLYKRNDRFTDEEGALTGCIIRPMTIKECERLQTLPDGYTEKSGCNRSECIEAIGNGWTVDVICHLMQGLKNWKELHTPYESTNPDQCEIKFPELTPEPGFVYWNSDMTIKTELTQEDVDKLPKKCYVCGKSLEHTPILNAVLCEKIPADDDGNDEELRPICMDCEMDRRADHTLKQLRHVISVDTVPELLHWIHENVARLEKSPLWNNGKRIKD